MEYWVCPVSNKKRKEEGKYLGKSEPPNPLLSASLIAYIQSYLKNERWNFGRILSEILIMAIYWQLSCFKLFL